MIVKLSRGKYFVTLLKKIQEWRNVRQSVIQCWNQCSLLDAAAWEVSISYRRIRKYKCKNHTWQNKKKRGTSYNEERCDITCNIENLPCLSFITRREHGTDRNFWEEWKRYLAGRNLCWLWSMTYPLQALKSNIIWSASLWVLNSRVMGRKSTSVLQWVEAAVKDPCTNRHIPLTHKHTGNTKMTVFESAALNKQAPHPLSLYQESL